MVETQFPEICKSVTIVSIIFPGNGSDPKVELANRWGHAESGFNADRMDKRPASWQSNY